jgi:hypothetical protein
MSLVKSKMRMSEPGGRGVISIGGWWDTIFINGLQRRDGGRIRTGMVFYGYAAVDFSILEVETAN